MEITYHWEDDYLIPDLKLSDTTGFQIGKYGRMRQRFLKENHGGIYSHMILSETLWKHLAEIDEECNEMMYRLMEWLRGGETKSPIALKMPMAGFCRMRCVTKMLTEALISVKIFYKKRCYRKATVRLSYMVIKKAT